MQMLFHLIPGQLFRLVKEYLILAVRTPFQLIFPCHAVNTSTVAGNAAIDAQVDALGDEGSKGTGKSP